MEGTEKQRVVLSIFGEEYPVRTTTSPEHLQKLARVVDRVMRETAKAHPRLGTNRVAVLAALNIADELVRLQEQYDRLTAMLEDEWGRRQAGAKD
ncbi:MAG: cell division protein ZapA [bacterium]|nr:cell division protein ZapA [bacterium]